MSETMATPNEKLADSLSQLKSLQDQARRVIRSGDLSRTHRERLVRAGFLEEVIKGWYLPARPDAGPGPSGTTAAWMAGMRDFVVGYCNERFGNGWHLAPEQSLLLRSGERSLPRQLQIWSPAGNNQLVSLPHDCSLFLYRAAGVLPNEPSADDAGMRLVELADALVGASPAFYAQQPLAASICLGLLEDPAPVLRSLLEGSRTVVAGRLAGAFRALGRGDFADDIVGTMRNVGHVIKETDPFIVAPSPLKDGRPESPYVQRMRRTWATMRELVIKAFPKPAKSQGNAVAALRDIEARYVADAYHSLSIEGYQVTPELIEKVRLGSWDPDGIDRQQRDAMAAKGYFESHQLVAAYVSEVMRETGTSTPLSRSRALREAVAGWYRALFSPSVQAGVLKAADLAGWRNEQVFIRGAQHVPLSKEAVRDCMPVLFELIADEPHPAARALLGHFFFVYIHPYMDGNGRLARFLMNALLATGGYVWTIIPVERRSDYMDALEQASTYGDIEPFAALVARLCKEQSTRPLPRPT
ncbi:Fic family protein [Roseateles sp.]|uniref:Fic family protein n=1 Tax=Roseateles sp. TaxID=1971397 RepID=UPI0031DF4932